MKVAELRAKLAKMTKAEAVKLAAEFYKLVPRAKREDYQLDKLINNPSAPKVKKKVVTKVTPLPELEITINTFIENVKNQHYIYPNRVVARKDRRTWRFKVKRWFKELCVVNRVDKDLPKQFAMLTKLYKLMVGAKYYSYFSSTEPFNSIQIEQGVFFKTVLSVCEAAFGKVAVSEEALKLMMLSSVYEQNYLTAELLTFLDIPDLKYKALEQAKILQKEWLFIQDKKSSYATGKDYQRREKNNSIAKIIFFIYMSLLEYDEAIVHFKKYYRFSNREVEVYILVDLLFKKRKKDLVLQELELAINEGVKLRSKLIKLLKITKEEGELPQYMPY